MSDLEQFAQWLVKNQDKRGTQEFETVANAFRSLDSGYRAPAPTPAEPDTRRTALESVTDIGAAALQGLGQFAQFPGQLTKLIPGLYGLGEAIEKPGESLAELGESLKSKGLLAREALRSKALSAAEKEGVIAEFTTALGQTIKDPALLTTFIAQQLPQLIGPAAAAKVAARTATKGLAAEAAAEAAQKAAYRAAVGTGATMQGADIASDVLQEGIAIAKQQNPGISDEQALDIAINKARLAGLGAGITSLVTQRLPGAQAIERRMAGLPGAGRLTGAAGEALSEAAEEGGGAFLKNLALQQIDPTRELLAGVGSAAGLGALGGGALGAILSQGKPPEAEPLGELQDRARMLKQQLEELRQTEQAPALPTDKQLFTLAAQPNGYGLLENLKQRVLQDASFPEADRKAAADNIANIQNRMIEEEATRAQTPKSVVSQEELKQAGIAANDPIASIVNKDFLADNQVFDTINQALSGEISDTQRQKYEGLYEGLSQLRQDFYPEGQDAGIPQMFTLPTPPVEEKVAEAPTEEVAAAPAAPKGPTERQQRIEFGKAIGAVQPYPGTLAGRVNLPAQKAAREGNFRGVIDALKNSKNAIVAEIARRAKSLKTKIAIDDDAVETYQTRSPVMDQFSADSAKMHVGLLEKLRELAPTVDVLPDGAALPQDVLAASTNVFEGGEDRGKTLRIKDAVNADNSMFAPLGLGEGAKFDTKEDFKRTLDAFERLTSELGEGKLKMTAAASMNATGVAGVYDAGKDTIFVPEYSSKDERTLSHEIVHAQTVEAIRNPTEEQKPIVERLEKLYNHVKKTLDERAAEDKFFRMPYGMESLEEFVAEGLGNPDFQYTLSRIEYENTTAWDKFTKYIAKLLGLKPDNAFTELLQIYSDITTPAKIAPEERVKRIRGPMPPKMPAGAKELPQPKAPAQEEIVQAEKAIRAAERQARTAKRESDSLFTALRGKLTKTEVSDVGGNSLRFRPLVGKGKGDSISTFVANGDLDPWLPPDKRLGAPNYDEYDNTEFIKDQLRQGNFLTHDANVRIKAAFEGIAQADSLIREHLTPKEVEALVNEAENEQRRIDQETKRTPTERPPSVAEEENVAEALDLKAEEAERPAGKPAKKSLAAVTTTVPAGKFAELQRRAEEARTRPEEPTAESEEQQARALAEKELIAELDKTLKRILAKFGLKDIDFSLEDGLTDEGLFEGRLIRLALDVNDPVRVLRHESIHALKELGFFSDSQWKSLVKRAESEWIQTHLKDREHKPGQSRYDAYVEMFKAEGKTDAEIQEALAEEAIADAFGIFEKETPPPGMMAAILRRMNNLFKAIKQAFNLNGIESAEEIFGKVEKGELKPAVPMGKVKEEAKASLRSGAVKFDQEEINKNRVPGYKSKNKLIEMSIDDFLGLSKYTDPESRYTKDKLADVRKLIEEGKPFNSLPYLTIDQDGQVDGHEGRHRAMALKELGYRTMPVELRSMIRWSEQGDPENFDYRKFPAKLHAQAEALNPEFTVPFPVKREDAMKPYDTDRPAAKASLRAPQTEAFKRWFGDSKVVDENGEPRVMYHGTRQDVIEPRTRGNRNAFFVTPDANFANKYALNDLDWFPGKGTTMTKGEEGANVLPVYIKASNPFDYENVEHMNKLVPQFKRILKLEEGYSNAQIDEVLDNFREGRWTAIEHANDYDLFETNGFDAFYVKEQGRKNLGVFRPEQVKSAIGNYGTYESTSPDIRKSLRSVGKPATRGSILAAAEVAQQKTPYMNCQLCVQLATGVSNIRDLPKVKEAKIGDIYTFNETETMASHYAIDVGNGEVLEVEEWGEPVRIVPLSKVVSEYDEPSAIRRPPETAYSEEVFDKSKALREKKSLRSIASLTPQEAQRLNTVTVPRREAGFKERIMETISPRSFSYFRQKAINRVNVLAEQDKYVAKQIKLMGGAEQLADAKAETAALQSDLAAGVTAAAMGVHDRVGGTPVYVKHYVVEKDFRVIGPKYPTRRAAELAASRIPGASVFERGYTTVTNKNNSVKGLIAIFAPLAKYGDPKVYQHYQLWAMAKRGKRLDAEGREKTLEPPDYALAKKFDAQYNQNGEWDKIQAEWIKYNDGLVDYMVDTGVISAERGKIFKAHGDYFPFYRQLEEEDALGPKVFQSPSRVQAPKALKGSEAPVGDFFENLVRNTQSAIQAGMKNVAGRRATDQALRIGSVKKLPTAPAKQTADIYRVLEDGKEVYYRADDPLFIDAIKSLNLGDLPFIGLLSAPANVLRNLVTKDPAFMLANMMRDSLSAYTTSGVKMTPIAATLANFGRAIAGQSPELTALLNAGVIGGYDYSQGVQTSAKRLEKEVRKAAGMRTAMEKITSPVTSLWDALEKGTQASDAATRMEVYKKVLAETGNEAEALWQALEVMNFNRKGNSPIVRVLTAAVPFLNARIQGLDLLYRVGFRPMIDENATDEQKARMRSFWVRGMTMMALSSMYWLMTHDDDDYKKQEQETRDNYWLIPSMGVKIPIPFEVGVLFKVVPERILELSYGQDTGKDTWDSVKRNVLSTFAFNPIPQTFLPVFEAVTNHSFFTGRPIVAPGMEEVAPEFQVSAGTSRFAELLGKNLGLSPIKVDHVIKGYTGTIGGYAADVFDMVYDMNADVPKASKRMEQMPVIRRFLIDPEARGTVTAYYDLKNSVDEVVRTSNYLERTMNYEDYGKYMQENINVLATREYVLDMEKTMKEFRDTRVLIQNSQMDADAKRDALKAINQAENQITSNIRTIKKAIQ